MAEPAVVVLRFADRIMVDIVVGKSAQDAIADFAGRVLARGAKLPLIEVLTSEITGFRLGELAETAAPALDGTEPAKLPSIPVLGALRAIGTYMMETKRGKVFHARGVLSAFFERFGCTLDFAGEPEVEVPEAAKPQKSGELIDPLGVYDNRNRK